MANNIAPLEQASDSRLSISKMSYETVNSVTHHNANPFEIEAVEPLLTVQNPSPEVAPGRLRR